MNLTELTAASLRSFFCGGCGFLAANKERVDALNVFPVPDGDTGTNMSLTMQSAIKDLETLTGASQVASAVSTGALMGARGNSGVILSQLFRGFAQGIGERNLLTAGEFAFALQKGVELAYKSVMKPVEGTILTVSKAVANGAVQKAQESGDVIEVLTFALEQGKIALENTPNLLPVLKQAGVVDAGGKGFMVIMEGGLRALRGEAVERQVFVDSPPVVKSPRQVDEEIVFQYCTELIIKGVNLSTETIKAFLQEKGDCLLVVGTEDLIKIHIHTNNPGFVLDYAVGLGTLHDIKIENMKDQHRETLFSGEVETEINCAVIVVVAGDGLVRIFTSLGAGRVINGGQTMNPSAEDLVNAINNVAAKEVVILPNNSNIILTARQAVTLVNKPVFVVPTKSLAQGLAAMLAFEEDQSAEENGKKMTQAFSHVKTGEVTYAIRNSSYNGISIKENDILGLYNGSIVTTGQDVDQVVIGLINNMVSDDNELITLFYGEQVTEEDAKQLAEQVAGDFPNLEVEIHYGGQPLYYYLISVE